MYISPIQAITFWDQLVRAYHGCANYGGDVAEVYLYSMMSHSPVFANNPDSRFAEDVVAQAKQSMRELIAYFESTYPYSQVLEGTDEGTYGAVELEGTWRYYLKVVHIDAEGEEENSDD
jgi:hypothetical protein